MGKAREDIRKSNGEVNVLIYIIIFIIFVISAMAFFLWKICGSLSIDKPINSEMWGQYGDFVGGTLGVLFSLISIIIVVRTFNTQNKTAKIQRFNDLFFGMLHLYQSEVKDLCGQSEVISIKNVPEKDSLKVIREEVDYDNKDFFDEEKKILQNKYRNQKLYDLNRTRSINYYMLFYTENRSKIAAYYRTLYRIFELIDESDLITEPQRKEYSKIIRAQLTESELFFLRYNAMTIYGNQFVKYLNKYRILKHLSAFELLEYKNWWRSMNKIDRESINILYYTICEALKKMFKMSEMADENRNKYEMTIFPQKNARYQITLLLENKHTFSIKLDINKLSTNMTNEYLGIKKLNENKLQELLDCFIKEIFLYSNFCQYNEEKEIKTFSSLIINKDNIIEINSGIQNISLKPLVIKYSI